MTNCFLAGTQVLMADESTKKIEEIKVGDKVLATDPETGRTDSRKVTALIVTEGDKLLNELTIETKDGEKKLTATREHPFWVPSERQWVEAGDLRRGMKLRTSDGSVAEVRASRSYSKHERTYNFTVEDVHTYYVLAGSTAILVHNTCGEFAKSYEGGAMVMASLKDGVMSMVMASLKDGVMSMAIESPKGSPTKGYRMFDDAMAHFGKDVRGFSAKWVPAMPSNLNEFNANLRAGMSYEEAAANTFTGRNTARHGLTKVTVDQGKLRGSFGNYTNVEPLFSRP
ncbi:Hint domain-containing protein [Streptomyces sp. NPDC056230]|uniref:Hint domain-containing protein n=1 Tax=Streptomyces sp. NPDC056230 TaxID=3345754 RepID=UPI0035E1FFDB